METKICNKCHELKTITEFVFRDKKNNVLKNNCKICDKNARKEYYKNNKERIIESILTTNREIKIRNQQFVWDYLKEHPCIDCGQTNPVVLDFDHRDGVNKTSEISVMVEKAWSITKIIDEIEKCDVRCANCHRIRTAKQFGWYSKIKT